MSTETKVGLFTFLGLVLLGISVFILGNFTVSSGYDIKVYFADVSGLPAKSVARLNGVEVGRVKALVLDQGKVAAMVKINKGVLIYKNAVFSIAANSIIGSNYLQIMQGDASSGILQDGDIIQGQSMPSMSDMITETMSAVRSLTEGITNNGQFAADLNATLQNLRQLSGNLNALVVSLRPYISDTANDISQLTSSTKDLMQKVEYGDGLLTALMNDNQMKEDTKQTLSNVKQLTEDAKAFIGKMAKFRLFWEYDVRFQTDAKVWESDLFVKLQPRNEFSYYRIGMADLGDRDNMPKNDKDYRPKPNRIDARLGLYNAWADVNVGMIRGSGGAVLTLFPFFEASSRIIKEFGIYGEFTDLGRNRYINNRLFDNPNISVGAKTMITQNVGVGVRVGDILESASFQLTGHISFEDKELAALLGLASLAK